jgi:hypothetical protein
MAPGTRRPRRHGVSTGLVGCSIKTSGATPFTCSLGVEPQCQPPSVSVVGLADQAIIASNLALAQDAQLGELAHPGA